MATRGFRRTTRTRTCNTAPLKKAGCAKIFTDDGISGATAKRPALLRCLKALERGDSLTVWKLDRLGRSLRDLITILDDLKQRGVTFRSLTEAIDTHTPTGRAMWKMIGVMAAFERSLISERTRAGVTAAKGRGVKFGRKPVLTPEQIDHAKELRTRRKDPKTPRQIARILKCSPATVYRALVGETKMPTLAEIHTLHRYYIWANRFRANFDRVLGAQNVDAIDPLLWFAGEAGMFLSYWYSALYVVVEGWNELGLKDSEIDGLLTSPKVGHLKRYRHGVCHFQRHYLDQRFQEMMSSPDSVQ